MDVVLTKGSEDVNSVVETKLTENPIMTEEALEKHECLGVGFRKRRKSKYLSDPYTDMEVDFDAELGSNRFRNNSNRVYNNKHAAKILSLNQTNDEETHHIYGAGSSIKLKFDVVKLTSPPETEMTSEHSSNLSTTLRTCLSLRFSPGTSIPSKQDLMTTFCQFGPLRTSETQLLEDIGGAQIVFVESADAAAAFHSLEQKKISFGFTLVDYKLQHVSATPPPLEQPVNPSQPTGSMAMSDVNPIQPTGSMTMPSVTRIQPIGSMTMPSVTPIQPIGSMSLPSGSPPTLQFMKQNLQMMASTLESSGNSLAPQMRAQLDAEIKNLMRKVNARLGHISP